MNRHVTATGLAAGLGAVMLVLAACGSSSPPGMTANEVQQALTEAGAPCGAALIKERTYSDGSAVKEVSCDAYLVKVWEDPAGLKDWWSKRCSWANASPDVSAIGAYWTTDVQTPERADFIAQALGGKAQPNSTWCSDLSAIPG